jgi:hypothetical protein
VPRCEEEEVKKTVQARRRHDDYLEIMEDAELMVDEVRNSVGVSAAHYEY